MEELHGVEPAPSPSRSTTRLHISPEVLTRFAAEGKLVLNPELVFGLVRTLGSDLTAIIQELEANLASAGFVTRHIKLSSLLTATDFRHEADRYHKLMTAGDKYRSRVGDGNAVARLAVREIIKKRQESYQIKGKSPTAWIIDSLMHPKEVETLRGVYGARFFVIACDAPRHERHATLKNLFTRWSGLSEAEADREALNLINRDAGLTASTPGVDKKFCLSTGRTLELADAFARTDNPSAARTLIRRLVECIFSHPFHAPTPDEFGMAVAFQAALTTATLSRRVGAAVIVDEQIVAVGTNEVPKSGGHVYHSESDPDAREWIMGGDPSDGIRAGILADLLRRLKDEGWLTQERSQQTPQQLTKDALRNPGIKNCQVFDVVEYSRTVHAEMVAVTGAARLGISISHGTLYTTTLPCHECTRNIIASGISRVVYVEPYPKSRGPELQSQSMVLVSHHGEHARKIAFELFTGISYRRFPDLFSWVARKHDDELRSRGAETFIFDGSSVNWKAQDARIRPSILSDDFGSADLLSQAFREDLVARELPPEL